MLRVLGVAVGIVAVILLGFLTVTAGGAPSAPTGTISATPAPNIAQTLSVTLSSQAYSLQVPNSIDLLGSHFVYSVYQTSSTGGRSVIAYNQQVAASANGQVGSLFTLTATVTFTTAAVCSGANCANGAPYNITVYATAVVPTYTSLWSSPNSTIVFSNTPSLNVIPPLSAPSYSTYGLEFWVPLTLLVAVVMGIGALFLPRLVILALLALLVMVIEVVVWAA